MERPTGEAHPGRTSFRDRGGSPIPVVSFVGRSGSGKTTALEKVVAELKERGLRVGTIKHDAHRFEIDHPGKDTWRLTQAGADAVIISSPEKLALMERVPKEWPLDRLVALLEGRVDIVLTEGYRSENTPKVEVFRGGPGEAILSRPEELLAIVTDTPLPARVPQFRLDQVAALVDHLLSIAPGVPGIAWAQPN